MSEQGLRVFGIDLGTTYSAIAYVDETGRPTVCRNTDSLETTPSVVYFENESNVVVGSVAKNSGLTYPDRVVSLIKRQMGAKSTYEFDGVDHTPESISALILKQLAKDAAEYTNGDVADVVITVPAYFGMLEKDATKKAGQIAGLNVIGIVPEPVAAALHYEATAGGADRTILVYDLGGGTFDTTVIKVSQDEIEVLCTDGNDHLGGADWDAQLRDHLLSEFRGQMPPDADVEPEDDEEFMQALALAAEETKKQLSRTESRPVALRGAGMAARITVSRAQFEEMTGHLLDQTVEIVRRTLDTLASKAPGISVDDVLLVGGSSMMPAVSKRLNAEFGWDAKLHDPHLAVAKGAALFALGRVVHKEIEEARAAATGDADAERKTAAAVNSIAAKANMSPETLERVTKETRNVLPKAFGVKLLDTSKSGWQQRDPEYYVEHLVKANDTLPTEWRVLNAATVSEGQQAVEIELFEQSGIVAGPQMDENKALTDGAGRIEGLPPLPAGSPVDIEMMVGAEGLLTIKACERSTGKELLINVNVSTMTEEQVEDATKVVAGLTVSG
jgi:molecular chaperone DnaK (HSP70)